MNDLASQSRRRFLRGAAAAGISGAALGPWATLQALAQAAQGEDYRALVCLFMFGGNDANNLLIPYEPADHARYATLRTNLALARDTLLPITPSNTGGVRYALHPSFVQLQGLFGAGKVAMLANIGPLVQPTTKAQYQARSVPLPANLYSHSDQQNAWQSDILDAPGRSGWGGRLQEAVASQNVANPGYACISVASSALWGSGAKPETPPPYRVSPSGQFGLNFYTPNGTDARSKAVAAMLGLSRTDPFERSWLSSVNRALDVQRVLTTALSNGGAGTAPFPNTDLGRQMQMIAKLISVRGTLGLKRQCFFCSIGGFDTHGADQLGAQINLFAQIDAAVAAFQSAIEAMGLGNQVTLFTASDFGRTCVSNGAGSDHGWGSHHFVVGGAVDGGRLVGTFPQHVLGGPDDVGSGNWLPTTSLDQLGGELGRWFGVAEADLPTVFPRLGNFDRIQLMRA